MEGKKQALSLSVTDAEKEENKNPRRPNKLNAKGAGEAINFSLCCVGVCSKKKKCGRKTAPACGCCPKCANTTRSETEQRDSCVVCCLSLKCVAVAAVQRLCASILFAPCFASASALARVTILLVASCRDRSGGVFGLQPPVDLSVEKLEWIQSSARHG